jgi:hypothetical protein
MKKKQTVAVEVEVIIDNEPVKKRKYEKCNKIALQNAFQAVVNKEMTSYAASLHYKVPISSIEYRKKQLDNGNLQKWGNPTLFTEAEEELNVRWIIISAEHGN